MTNKPAADQVTPEVIANWKKAHGKVTRYKTKDGKVVYFRSPDRDEVTAAQRLAEKEGGIQSNEFLAKTCALGGDVEICEQDKYLFAMGEKLKDIVDRVEGESETL